MPVTAGAVATEVNLNDAVPTPPSGAFPTHWAAGAPYADPNLPGKTVRDTISYHYPPPVGGARIKTANYTLLVTDTGYMIVFNSGSPVTALLPAIVPILPTEAGRWNVLVTNIGAGALTIDPNGLDLDGSPSTLALAQGQGVYLSTDGADYFSERGMGSSSGGGAAFADDETPGGLLNGSNVNFTLAIAPNPAGSLKLFKNGVLQRPGIGNDYTLSGLNITMAAAPASTDILLAFYRYTGVSTADFADDETPGGALDGANVTFTLAFAPSPATSLELYLNGVLQRPGAGNDFQLSGLTITMASAPSSTDVLIAFYRHAAVSPPENSMDYHVISAATTNAASVKGSSGTLTGWKIFNNAIYPIFVKLFDKASSPTPGVDTVKATIGVQGGSSSEVGLDSAIAYSTGIGIAIVKGIADLDNTAVAAGDCSVDLFYT